MQKAPVVRVVTDNEITLNQRELRHRDGACYKLLVAQHFDRSEVRGFPCRIEAGAELTTRHLLSRQDRALVILW